MKIKKQIKQMKRALKNNNWMVVCVIVVLFIMIKNCEIPIVNIIRPN